MTRLLRDALLKAFPDRLCRKIRHDSQGAAETHLRASLKRYETCEVADRLVVYPCHRCKGWHVGHEVSAAKAEAKRGRG